MLMNHKVLYMARKDKNNHTYFLQYFEIENCNKASSAFLKIQWERMSLCGNALIRILKIGTALTRKFSLLEQEEPHQHLTDLV